MYYQQKLCTAFRLKLFLFINYAKFVPVSFMANVENIYKEINQKIDRLIAKQEALKEENDMLKQKLDVSKQAISGTELTIKELNEKIKVLSMAKSLTGDNESNKEMKLKINEMVREIDKCISLLNN